MKAFFRLLVVAAGVMGGAIALGARAQQASPPMEPENVFESVLPSVGAAGEARSEHPSADERQIWYRLRDPTQRASARVELRSSVREQHPELAEALGIDAATADKILELLTDQQIEQFVALGDESGAAPADGLQKLADAQTQHLVALQELLGEDGFEKYRSYADSLGERMQVRFFEAHLNPDHKLLPEQRDRLIALLQEQNRHVPEVLDLPPLRSQAPQSREELQRSSQLATIAINEENWRNMQRSHRQLTYAAAEFLSPQQIAALSQMSTEQERSLRQWIERERVRAGLSPEIPARATVPQAMTQSRRAPVAGNVKVEITVQVNRSEPTRFSHAGPNGEPMTFEVAEGLIVQATPTLYDDDWLEVRTVYYEPSRAGKRQIASRGFGILLKWPDGTVAGSGGGETMITGRKGYALMESATATAL